MTYTIEDLECFWQAASRPIPLLIVGGGRWGRVWAGVAADARGSSRDIAILSRHHSEDVASWCGSTQELTEVSVCPDITGVPGAIGKPGLAIIASRPRDHVRDAMEALQIGAHTLVEKPFSDDVEAAKDLLKQYRKRMQVLGIGTEFAYLPALHHLAHLLRRDAISPCEMQITWSDPLQEFRHGALKREHSEVGILEDLLPHIMSMVNVLLPSPHWEIANAVETLSRGELRLTDGTGHRVTCVCSKEADVRERLITFNVNGESIALDFAGTRPMLSRNGHGIPLPQRFLALNSTLRLELGAFNQAIEQSPKPSPLTNVAPLLELHEQLLTKRSDIYP